MWILLNLLPNMLGCQVKFFLSGIQGSKSGPIQPLYVKVFFS